MGGTCTQRDAKEEILGEWGRANRRKEGRKGNLKCRRVLRWWSKKSKEWGPPNYKWTWESVPTITVGSRVLVFRLTTIVGRHVAADQLPTPLSFWPTCQLEIRDSLALHAYAFLLLPWLSLFFLFFFFSIHSFNVFRVILVIFSTSKKIFLLQKN